MIVIPAAGDGTRFRQAGYKEPKHLIPLGGRTMVQWVIQNVYSVCPSGWFVITQDTVGKTRGAVDTILKGYEVYKNYEDGGSLLIANCDQLLIFPEDLEMMGDGIIFTFRSANPAHSYVLTDHWLGKIYDIVEKPEVPPSDRAVSGVYWFRKAGPFLEACRQVDHEGELYVSSALKVMIEQGYDLYAQDAPTAILGTPEDFQRFEVALACAKS